MIQQIGFKNFRRFENFHLKGLGPINIFVGRNNSGKSTVIRALRLKEENMHFQGFGQFILRGHKPTFRFDLYSYAEAGYGDFNRNLYSKAQRKEISFIYKINDILFEMFVDGSDINNISSVILPLSSARVKGSYFDVVIDYTNGVLHCNLSDEVRDDNDKNNLLSKKGELQQRKSELKKDLKACDNPITAASISDNIKSIDLQIKNINLQLSTPSSKSRSFDIDVIKYKELFQFDEYCEGYSEPYYLLSQFCDFDFSDKSYEVTKRLDKRSSEYKTLIDLQTYIKSYIDKLRSSFETINKCCSCNVSYIGAHAATQDVIVRKKDINTLSRIVTAFSEYAHYKGDKLYEFALKWMKKFEIGQDFKIDNIENEGYIVRLFDGQNWINLSDYGTGSIQLFTLILAMALEVGAPAWLKTWGDPDIIIVEEPEQNIHPMLQAKLADFFLDVHEMSKYGDLSNPGRQIFVETHSEYLVRRIQVLVAKEAYKDEKELQEHNPFKVFYFPYDAKENPYELGFNPNGRFIESFGEGFYDAAGDLALKLSENEIPRISSSIDWSAF